MTVEKVPLKEQALNAKRIRRIADEIHAVLPAFDADAFVTDVMNDLPQLELKARIARTSQALHLHLRPAGDDALTVLLRSLPPTPEAAGVTNDFGLHIYSPHSDYVARYCRADAHLDHALAALRTFTSYFSAEDAVRYFLNDYPDRTLAAVHAWARDGDYRVRRLASESTRPRLPWSPRLTLPPVTGIPILDHLHADSHAFVARSVANHLRDIADIDPDLALATLSRWRATQQATDRQLTFIAREALKNQIKKGWLPAYQFLGYATDAAVEVSAIRLRRATLRAGEALEFDATLSATQSRQLHVTYVISSTTSTAKRREKVYFLCRTAIEAGCDLTLAKTHILRSTAAQPVPVGNYALAFQVNGCRSDWASFKVI